MAYPWGMAFLIKVWMKWNEAPIQQAEIKIKSQNEESWIIILHIFVHKGPIGKTSAQFHKKFDAVRQQAITS